MEKDKYLIKDNCSGNAVVIAMTTEQARLLDWLYQNDWLHDDVTYDRLEDVECVEI